MRGLAVIAACGAGAASLLALTAAQQPAALAQTSRGLWELTGVPGSPAPVRRCIVNTAALSQIEHRGQSCTRVVISDTRASAVIHYTCTNNGFGRSEMTVLTPRSLRIETQGISNNAPFHYVVQARRVGDCPAH